MSQYSYLDELIIAEALVIDLNEVLHTTDRNKAENICRQLRNLAARLLRKLQQYEDFYEHAEIVAGNVRRVSFLNFDAADSQIRKEQQ